MSTHHLVSRGRIRLAFFLSRRIAAELAPRVPQGMLGDEAFKPAFHRIRQGIVSGARIGKLGVAPGGRNRLGMQHRPSRGFLPKRAVGMPESVPQHERCARVIVAEDAAVLIKIGDVEYFPVLYPCGGRDRRGFAPNARRYFKWPIEPRKGDLLVVLQMLTGQHANRVRVHRPLDRALDVFADRPAQVDFRNLGNEVRMKRRGDEGHYGRLLAQDCRARGRNLPILPQTAAVVPTETAQFSPTDSARPINTWAHPFLNMRWLPCKSHKSDARSKRRQRISAEGDLKCFDRSPGTVGERMSSLIEMHKWRCGKRKLMSRKHTSISERFRIHVLPRK